ncbi:MAG: PqqD family protein [Rhodospirillaceae bacterium]
MSQALITKNPEVLATEIENETILMSPATGAYCTLNGTGSAIWTLLDTPMTLDSLTDALCARYGKDRAEIEDQVSLFVQRMQEEQIVLCQD